MIYCLEIIICSLFFFGFISILLSCFNERQKVIAISTYNPLEVLNSTLFNGSVNQICKQDLPICYNKKMKPFYKKTILLFMDAVGYRYVQQKNASHPIFNQITLFKNTNKSYLSKTINIPPSTDFTICSIMTGINQRYNYIDSIFKIKPDQQEDSFIKQLTVHKYKSSLQSGKRFDWHRMKPGQFTFLSIQKGFNLSNITKSDQDSFLNFTRLLNPVEFQVLHLIGFDALGHALAYQDYDRGVELLRYFNEVMSFIKIKKTASQIIKNLDQKHLFIALGDHDQGYRGRHFQCSKEGAECSGFLYLFSRNDRVPYNNTIEPVDISVTMHTLQGLPISFQAIGKVIPQMYQIGPSETNGVYLRILCDITLNIHHTREVLSYIIEQDVLDQDYILDMFKRLERYQNKIQTLIDQFIYQVEIQEWDFVIACQSIFKEQDTLFDSLKDSNRYQKVHKPKIYLGIFLLAIGIITIYIGSLSQLTIMLKTKINYICFFIYHIFSLIGIYGVICQIFLLILKEQQRRYNIRLVIKIIGIQLLLYLSLHGYFGNYLKPVSFLMYLVIKIQILKKNYNVIIFIMIFISQALCQLYYVIDKYNIVDRQILIYIEIGYFALSSMYLSKFYSQVSRGRFQVNHWVMLFIFADICTVLQLNEIASSLYSSMIFFTILSDVSYETQDILIKILQVKYAIYMISPLMVPHEYYRGILQPDLNALVILVDDFSIIPSLVSIFLGAYGLEICSYILFYLIQKQYLIDLESIIRYFILPSFLLEYSGTVYKLISFKHSYGQDMNDIRYSLYMLPRITVSSFICTIFYLLLRSIKKS